MSSTAWDTARNSGALALMPYEEAQRQDDVYSQLKLVNEQATVVFRDVFASAAPVQGGRKLEALKPTELDAMLASSQQALVDLEYLDLLAKGLDAMYQHGEADE